MIIGFQTVSPNGEPSARIADSMWNSSHPWSTSPSLAFDHIIMQTILYYLLRCGCVEAPERSDLQKSLVGLTVAERKSP